MLLCYFLTVGGDTFPDALQEVSLPVVGQNQCKCLHTLRVPDKSICAGYAEGKKDACQVSLTQNIWWGKQYTIHWVIVQMFFLITAKLKSRFM